MKYFYMFCLMFTRADLIIARSTGRNPDNIRQLVLEENKYRKLVQDYEIRSRNLC